MTAKEIQSIGNFLAYYRSDLNYIKQFQRLKRNEILPEQMLVKEIGSFYSFLIEFRVVRNIPNGTVNKILRETLSWIKSENADNVDMFARTLAEHNLTNGVMTSMASKILFLNNPWEIIPMDQLARKSLNHKKNDYAVYKSLIEKFRSENYSKLENSHLYIHPLANIIQSEFAEICDLETICKNRLLDKLLWTTGK